MFGLVAAISMSCVLAVVDDCKECSPKKLCSAHVAEEAAALKSAAPKLKAKEEATRIEALEKLGHLKDSHQNAPSAAAAKAIAAGLLDASWKVRAAAAKVLADGQEHDVAVEALAKSITEARKDGAKLMIFTSNAALLAEQKLFGDYLKEISAALAAMKDDRAADALIEFVRNEKVPMPKEIILPAVEATATIDTLAAFSAVIEHLEWTEGFGGLQDYHDVLVKAATARGGKDLPEWGKETSARWKRWLEAHKALFPKRIAKA